MKVHLINMKTEYAVALGVLIPLVVFLLALAVVCACRRCRNTPMTGIGGYHKVEDDLDEEEIEFKRMIESRDASDSTGGGRGGGGGGGGNGASGGSGGDEDYEDDPDVENPFGGGDFSEKDKNRLNMLANFRHSLVKNSFNSHDSDSENDAMRL